MASRWRCRNIMPRSCIRSTGREPAGRCGRKAGRLGGQGGQPGPDADAVNPDDEREKSGIAAARMPRE
eukprot:2256884-Heterocapsa_arctica.AAC.1